MSLTVISTDQTRARLARQILGVANSGLAAALRGVSPGDDVNQQLRHVDINHPEAASLDIFDIASKG